MQVDRFPGFRFKSVWLGKMFSPDPANFFTDGYGLIRSAAEINGAGRDLRIGL